MVLYQRCVQLKWRDGTTNEIRELWERGILKGSLHVLCLFLCTLWQYLGYSFLSRISHIFFPKDHPKLCWRVLFWANACWCGGSKNKSHKQRQLFSFSVSMRWGSTERRGGRELVQISTPGSNFDSLKHHEASGVISSECCPRLLICFFITMSNHLLNWVVIWFYRLY